MYFLEMLVLSHVTSLDKKSKLGDFMTVFTFIMEKALSYYLS